MQHESSRSAGTPKDGIGAAALPGCLGTMWNGTLPGHGYKGHRTWASETEGWDTWVNVSSPRLGGLPRGLGSGPPLWAGASPFSGFTRDLDWDGSGAFPKGHLLVLSHPLPPFYVRPLVQHAGWFWNCRPQLCRKCRRCYTPC